MNPLRALPLAQRQFLFVATIVAVALLAMYVQLLHESLQRGDELREVQPASLRARQVSNGADARVR